MIRIETERLILRPFSDGDLSALFVLLSDEEVTAFLPMFPLKDMAEARSYLRYIETWIRNGGLYYAICLKDSDLAVGCIHVSGDDSHDLGYCIRKEFWHNGFCTESCRAVVDLLRRMGLPYITATHDVNNPRSGRVMQAIGMRYCYSYEELWQPKNFPVIFRLYQLNLDGQMDRVYREYWDRYPMHFVETFCPPPTLLWWIVPRGTRERRTAKVCLSRGFFCGRIGLISRISQARHSRRRAKPRGYAKLGRSSSGGCA